MLVSDFLSVHRSAPVRSKSECYQTLLLLSDAGASVRSNCIIACHDLSRARPDLIYLPPPFAFAAKMGVLWCVAGVREVVAGGKSKSSTTTAWLHTAGESHHQQNWPQPLSTRIFVSHRLLLGSQEIKAASARTSLQGVSERRRQMQEGEA